MENDYSRGIVKNQSHMQIKVLREQEKKSNQLVV